MGPGAGYESEALEGTGIENFGTWKVHAGTFKTLGVRVGSLQGYEARAFGTLGVRVLSLWYLGGACYEPLGPDGVRV